MKLSGHNILVISDSGSAQLMQQEFKQLDGNIFWANDHVQALALQHRWDIDIILSDVSFLSGMGDVIAHDSQKNNKKSPLLFVFGNKQSVHPNVLNSRGVLRFFAFPIEVSSIVQGISSFLFDPKKHMEELKKPLCQSQIRVLLQCGKQTNQLEVSEFVVDGLSASFENYQIESEVCSLSIFIPEEGFYRFAVRVEENASEQNSYKVKVLYRDKERWSLLLEMLKGRQEEINNFILASSGR